ncbi:hypothetical protein B1748_32960 [Paenibacillus sp. MY03]|nr:hypothetical protein B1748_32960 [Paenibacillus sp. MY03]
MLNGVHVYRSDDRQLTMRSELSMVHTNSYAVYRNKTKRLFSCLLVICLLIVYAAPDRAGATETKDYTELPAGLHLVSHGAPVTAYNGMVFNDSLQGNPTGSRKNLTDGNLTTKAGGYGAVDFYIDLGTIMPLNYVQANFSRLWDGTNKVYVSDDAANWTEVISGNGSQYEYLSDEAATNSLTEPNVFGALFPVGTEGRYVRLTAKSWADLFEFQIYSSLDPFPDYLEVPAGMQLISQDASVTAYNGMIFNDGSQGNPTEPRENITDGSLTTKAGGYGAVDFYIDLGQILPIDYVKVYFNRLWDGTNKVYISDDAESWTEVLSGDGSIYTYLRDTAATNSLTQPNELGALLPDNSSGRYVRLVTKNWANIYELQVYTSHTIPAEQITVTGPINGSVINGFSTQMNASITPGVASDSSVTWSVYTPPGSDGEASIHAGTGLLSAIAPGVVTVQATANDGSNVVGLMDVLITSTVEKWRDMEFSLTSSNTYIDPFMDVEVTATFTGPNEEILTRPAFWDGGHTWKVRFAPTAVGSWEVTTQATDITDTGLNISVPLSFESVPYSGGLDIYKRGFVQSVPNERYFSYDDGTPFFYLGDTHWLMPVEDYDSSNVEGIDSQFKYAVDHRVSQGYTVYQSEPLQLNSKGMDVSQGILAKGLAFLQDIDRKFQYVADAGLVHANASFTYTPALNVTDTTLLEKLGRYWQARYGAYPVMWTIAQESDQNFYNGIDPQYWQTFAEALYDSDAYKHPISAHVEAITTFATTWGDKDYHTWFAGQPILTTKDVFESFWNYPITKPFVSYETGYEFNNVTSNEARAFAYKAFGNGSYGIGYGVQGQWAVNNSPDDWFRYGPYYRWFDGLHAPAGSQMTYFKNFYSSIQWWKLVPTFNDTLYGELSSNQNSYLTTEGNKTYVAYFSGGSSVLTGKLKSMADTIYEARWFNPRSGAYTLISDQIEPTNGEWIIPAKPDDKDWALLVTSSQSSLVANLVVSSANNATTIVTQGGTLQMSASLGTDSNIGTISWDVTNMDGTITDLAAIDGNGVLTAIKNGVVKVIASTSGGAFVGSKSVILVRQDDPNPPAQALGLSIKRDIKGNQLLAYFEPSHTLDQRVLWEVFEIDGITPTDKALISEFGVVVPILEGTVRVVATALDGSGLSASYDFVIPPFNDVILNPLFTGATVTASSTDYKNGYRPIKAITSQHGSWSGWASDTVTGVTSYANPQWLQVEFAEPTTFNHLEIYTTKSGPNGFQMRDYDVQYWDNDEWVNLYSVQDNQLASAVVLFPEVTTSKIRVICYEGDRMGIARVDSIEVYQDIVESQ